MSTKPDAVTCRVTLMAACGCFLLGAVIAGLQFPGFALLVLAGLVARKRHFDRQNGGHAHGTARLADFRDLHENGLLGEGDALILGRAGYTAAAAPLVCPADPVLCPPLSIRLRRAAVPGRLLRAALGPLDDHPAAAFRPPRYLCPDGPRQGRRRPRDQPPELPRLLRRHRSQGRAVRAHRRASPGQVRAPCCPPRPVRPRRARVGHLQPLRPDRHRLPPSARHVSRFGEHAGRAYRQGARSVLE